MTERTSNKQLLEAIEAMPEAIAKAIASVATSNHELPTLVVDNDETPPKGGEEVQIDAAYRDHMIEKKVQPFADKNREIAVLYARKNARGEVKLAYCLASKWTGLKDRGLIGAIETVDPS